MLRMQLLFDVSYEVEKCEGLGIIKGEIQELPNYVKILIWDGITYTLIILASY